MGQGTSASSFSDAAVRIAQNDITLEDDCWKELFSSPVEVEDVFTVFTTHAARQLKEKRPDNFAMTIYQCAKQIRIFSAPEARKQPHEKLSPVPADTAMKVLARFLPVLFEPEEPAKLPTKQEKDFEARLTRFYEKYNPEKITMVPQALAKFQGKEDEMFEILVKKYGPEPEVAAGAVKDDVTKETSQSPKTGKEKKKAAGAEEEVDLSISESESEASNMTDEQLARENTNGTTPPVSFAQKILWGKKDVPFILPEDETLGQMLVYGLLEACFVPEYTISRYQNDDQKPHPNFPSVESHLMWSGGIAVADHHNIYFSKVEQYQTNRLLCLRAILACLCGDLYTRQFCAPNKMRALFTSSNTPHAATFCASLINVITEYVPSGIVPYSSYWTGSQEELIFRATEILTLLLDYDVFYQPLTNTDARVLSTKIIGKYMSKQIHKLPEYMKKYHGREKELLKKLTDKITIKPADGPQAYLISKHACWSVIHKLTPSDCEQISLGLMRLITCETYAKAWTVLPGSQHVIPFRAEYILLFWKLLDKSSKFHDYFVQSSEMLTVVVALLDFGMDGLTEPSKQQNIQLAITIINRLSRDRHFALGLNKPFSLRIPYDLQTFVGTHNDLLMLTLHKILTRKSQWVLPTHPSCLNILANVAPFVTSVCQTTAAKLINLLTIYAKPEWLEQHTFHPTMLDSLVLTVAHLIQYQYKGSSTVLYALVRNSSAIHELYASVKGKKIPCLRGEKGKRLLLFTLVCAIDAVSPTVIKMLEADPNADVLSYLEGLTLVGQLPVPHPIYLQPSISRVQTDAWCASTVWTMIYNSQYVPMIEPSKVKVFTMETVSNNERSP